MAILGGRYRWRFEPLLASAGSQIDLNIDFAVILRVFRLGFENLLSSSSFFSHFLPALSVSLFVINIALLLVF